MDFALSDEQQLLGQLVERFAADRCDLASRPALRRDASGRDAANWAMLAELGLLALPLPEEHGGMGGGPIELLVMMEAVGRHLVAEPILPEILLGGLALARAGGDADTIGRIAGGDAHVALAWAEPAARHRWDRPATAARDGRLSGTKTFVLAGADTDAFVVTASDEQGAPSLWLVAADAPGLIRQSYRLIDDSPAEELTLRDVPATRLADDAAAVEQVLDTARLGAAAEMLGIMEMLFATTLDYLKTRQQFGVAIGTFQALQHRMADQYARLQLSRSILYRAALAGADEQPTAIAAAAAYVGPAAIELAEECVQFHGGMGVSDETIVGHGLCRILLLANLFGAPQDELARYAALAA